MIKMVLIVLLNVYNNLLLVHGWNGSWLTSGGGGSLVGEEGWVLLGRHARHHVLRINVVHFNNAIINSPERH